MILLVNTWKKQSIQSYLTQYIRDMKNYCVRTAHYVDYYRKQIDYYNWTACEIIINELALMLSTFSKWEIKDRYHYIFYNRFYQFGI